MKLQSGNNNPTITSSNLPLTKQVCTEVEYDAYLKELRDEQRKVKLDSDPVSVGLGSFNDKLCNIQAARERVSQIMLDAIMNRALAQKLVNQAQADYDSSMNAKLATDQEIRNLRSADLRNSTLHVKFKNKVEKLQNTELDLAQADAFYKCVFAINKDLEAKNENLYAQIRTVQSMMGIDPAMREELRLRCQSKQRQI